MNLERREIRTGLVTLELVGAITMGRDCELLEQEVNDLLSQGTRQVILDLGAVQRVDSAAIGKIVACFSRVRGAGGTMRVACGQGTVREVLRMTQVDQILGLYPTAQAAQESLAS